MTFCSSRTLPGHLYSSEQRHRLGVDGLRRAQAAPVPHPGDEMLDQRRDVFLPLAKRRHDQVDDVEAIEEILAEQALRDHLAQVAVGRRDGPDVDAAAGAVGADLLDFAGFQEPEEQPLHAQRHLADFVHEDRALVGDLQLAGLVAIGAGEAPAHMAEQLRFEERLGHAGAVHGDKRAAGAVAERVDTAGRPPPFRCRFRR